MQTQDFLDATLDGLEDLTSIDKTRWCKYFNGATMSESTLYKLADAVKMTPSDFITALNARRDIVRRNKKTQ